jgi:hypothetical protein
VFQLYYMSERSRIALRAWQTRHATISPKNVCCKIIAILICEKAHSHSAPRLGGQPVSTPLPAVIGCQCFSCLLIPRRGVGRHLACFVCWVCYGGPAGYRQQTFRDGYCVVVQHISRVNHSRVTIHQGTTLPATVRHMTIPGSDHPAHDHPAGDHPGDWGLIPHRI